MRGVPRPAKEFAREGREGKIAGEPVTSGVESGASEESKLEHMYLAERATHPPLGLGRAGTRRGLLAVGASLARLCGGLGDRPRTG
jgi:hypothetical protein